jgi:hypothetical protein
MFRDILKTHFFGETEACKGGGGPFLQTEAKTNERSSVGSATPFAVWPPSWIPEINP